MPCRFPMPPSKAKAKVSPRPRPRPRQPSVVDEATAEAFEQSVDARDREPVSSRAHTEIASSQAHTAIPRRPARRATGKGTRAAPRVRATDGVAVRSTTIHVPATLHELWRDFAHETNLRMSEVAEEALREYLDSRRRR